MWDKIIFAFLLRIEEKYLRYFYTIRDIKEIYAFLTDRSCRAYPSSVRDNE